MVLLQYHSQFISNFAIITQPLYEVQTKGKSKRICWYKYEFRKVYNFYFNWSCNTVVLHNKPFLLLFRMPSLQILHEYLCLICTLQGHKYVEICRPQGICTHCQLKLRWIKLVYGMKLEHTSATRRLPLDICLSS